MALSKFDILNDSVNKIIKSRRQMPLIDIISLLCISLNTCIDDYKYLIRLNTLLIQLDSINDLSVNLIKIIYKTENNQMQTEHKYNDLNLEIYTIFVKLRGSIDNVSDLLRQVFLSEDRSDNNNAIMKSVLYSNEFLITMDALIVAENFHTTNIFKCISRSLWNVFYYFIRKPGKIDERLRLLNYMNNNIIFANFLKEEKVKEFIEIEKQVEEVLVCADKSTTQLELYTKLNFIKEYSIYQLIRLLNNPAIRKDLNLERVINDAIINKFDIKSLQCLKYNLIIDEKIGVLTLSIGDLATFYNDLQSNPNITDNTKLQKLIEPFRVEIIKSNIFDEFKKQKDIQTCSKYAGIKNTKKTDRETWRKMIDNYVVNVDSLLMFMAFFDYVYDHLTIVLTTFIDNKLNLIGIMTNILLFYFSYFDYIRLPEHRIYLSADSFPQNLKKIQNLIEIIVNVFDKIADTYSEPINENLYTLEAFIKYYNYLSVHKVKLNNSDCSQTINSSKMVGIIFKSFKLENIWYKVFEMLKKGNGFLSCLQLIVNGFKVLNPIDHQNAIEFLLKKRDINDKLITYNYTKELDHYFKIARHETIFDLIFHLLIMQSDTWISANQNIIQDYFKAVLTSPYIETYDFLYNYITRQMADLVEKITKDSVNQEKNANILLFILEIVHLMTGLNHVKSYLLSRKFTTEIIKIEKVVTSLAIASVSSRIKRISTINWQILSILCNPDIGLRKIISGSKSNKIYVEDMPIETHLLEIFSLIFVSIDNQMHDILYENIILKKLEVLEIILSNSQGKNVFQQNCIVNKGAKFLTHLFESFDTMTIGVKLKLVDIVYNFKKIKDFKNLYLLDRLISQNDSKDVNVLVDVLEQLIQRLNNNLSQIQVDIETAYEIEIRLIMLEDIKKYIHERRRKILKSSFKIPKLLFNNEMPEEIETRFLLFRANKYHDNDFKSDVKNSLKHMDFNSLSEEIKKRARGNLNLVILSEDYSKNFKYFHTIAEPIIEKTIEVVFNRAKVNKNTQISLLPLKKIDSKTRTLSTIKLGTLINPVVAVKKQPEQKISASQSENEKEPISSSPKITYPPSNDLNPLLNFINPSNPPKIPLSMPMESGGNLLLQNLTPSGGVNKQLGNIKMQGLDLPHKNLNFTPPLMPNMPQFNFIPNKMISNPPMNHFPPFINPMMPNMNTGLLFTQKPIDNLLMKRQPQEFYPPANNNMFINSPNPQNYQYSLYSQPGMQMPYNAMPDYSKIKQPQNNRNYNRKDRISPQLDKYEFSDDDTNKPKEKPSTPPREDSIEGMDNSTMQFLKKLRRNRN